MNTISLIECVNGKFVIHDPAKPVVLLKILGGKPY